MKRLDPGRGKALVGDLVQAHEQLHQYFLEHVRANRAWTRTSASKELLLLIFVVGDLRDGGQGAKARRVAQTCERVDGILTGGVG